MVQRTIFKHLESLLFAHDPEENCDNVMVTLRMKVAMLSQTWQDASK
jgi:hypothetical protein